MHALPTVGKTTLCNNNKDYIDTDDIVDSITGIKGYWGVFKDRSGTDFDSVMDELGRRINHILSTTSVTVVTNFWATEITSRVRSEYLSSDNRILLGFIRSPAGVVSQGRKAGKSFDINETIRWVDHLLTSDHSPINIVDLGAGDIYLSDVLAQN